MKLTKLFIVKYDRVYRQKDEVSASARKQETLFAEAIAVPADSLSQAETMANEALQRIEAAKERVGPVKCSYGNTYFNPYNNPAYDAEFVSNRISAIECVGYVVLPTGIESDIIGCDF
jgi:hypothetical protein